MQRSLTFKLILAFLFVSLIGVALVALYVGQRTQHEFGQFVLDRDQEILVAALTQHYQASNTWDGAEGIFRYYWYRDSKQNPRPVPVILVDAQGQIVFGRRPDKASAHLTQAEFERGVPLKVNDLAVGWLVFDIPAAPRDLGGPERIFMERVNQAILFSMLGAGAVALILGILLARALTSPLRELTTATQALARGELGHQVSIRSRDELGELAASFNQMSADLARSSELRRQMTADIAHELRTPLSIILGYTEGLSEDKLQGTPETFEIIHDEANRLKRLIDDLRTLSLAEASELPLLRQPVAPQALLEHTALVYMAQAHKHNISLQVNAAPDLPAIDVDHDRMVQVLGNLVSNALRYTPDGGQIALSAERDGDKLLLIVRDSGAGIAQQDLPHIFDRFYRGDKSRSRQEGESGLGLAIAKSIVEIHGGTIQAQSTIGQGAAFIIALPPAQAGP